MDPTVVIILIGAFFAAMMNAAFATGGIFVLIAVCTAIYPAAVSIPLISALGIGSLIGRSLVFHRSIRWSIVLRFSAGVAIGVAIAAPVFVALPEALVTFALAVILLLAAWSPGPSLTILPAHYPVLGVAQGVLSTVSGLGGLLQAAIIRSPLDKTQITATLATALIFQAAMKITAFSLVGFNYLAFVPHIIAATLAGFAGTWLGRGLHHRISDRVFRVTFKILVTLLALRLLQKAWLAF